MSFGASACHAAAELYTVLYTVLCLDVYLPMDYYTKEARGLAYIEFVDEKEAETARRELYGVVLDGVKLDPQWAKGMRKSM